MTSGLTVDPLSGRDMAAFVAAFESQSMHGAADALGLTQSAVSKRVHALELRTGVTLFERGRHGVRPTEFGRLLYPEAKQALTALGRAAAAVEAATAARRHVLRLAASHTIGEFLLPGWLAQFRAADGNPMLRAEVDIVNSPGVLDRLRNGSADLGFVEGLDSLEGVESHTLMQDELLVVVAPRHRWARRPWVGAHELEAEPYLTRERDSGTRAVVTCTLASQGIRLRPALETASIQALKRAVLDHGFTVLPMLAVHTEVLAGTLRVLRVRGVSIQRELRVVRRGRGAPGAAAQRLWRWLHEH
ncbi:MAG TPA: LysR family transcriptional regulator [Solirubrobacteraceae bacterium]